MNRISIGPVNLDIIDGTLQNSMIKNFIDKGPHGQVITFNALMFNLALSNIDLLNSIKKSVLVLPDSAGIVWAVRYLYGKNISRFAGIDLINNICKVSLENKYKIFLFGSSKDVLEDTVKKLSSSYPGLLISGTHNGYFSDNEEGNIIEEIRKSGSDILLVALDMPRQEVWISRNIERLGVKLAMGVGGSFDVISGRLKRSPKWLQDIGFEWFFRLIQQPKRFFRILGLPVFIFNILSIRNKIKQ